VRRSSSILVRAILIVCIAGAGYGLLSLSGLDVSSFVRTADTPLAASESHPTEPHPETTATDDAPGDQAPAGSVSGTLGSQAAFDSDDYVPSRLQVNEYRPSQIDPPAYLPSQLTPVP
jgi:hypothetical protein